MEMGVLRNYLALSRHDEKQRHQIVRRLPPLVPLNDNERQVGNSKVVEYNYQY